MTNGYSCKAKQEVRNKLKNFVASVYPNESSRKDLKVLTLLGPQDYELNEIWDSLKFQRQNLTSVERDPEVYKIVQNKNLGINLIDNTIENFVEETNDHFDIINLDYTGYFSLAKMNTLTKIAMKNMICKKGIVATWYSGRREDKESLKFLSGWPDFDLAWMAHLQKNIPLDRIKQKFEGIIQNKTNSIEDNGYRAESISTASRVSFEAPYSISFSEDLVISKLGLKEDYRNFLENHPHVKEFKKELLRKAVNKQALPENVSQVTKDSFEAFKRMRNSVLNKSLISKEDEEIFFREFHGWFCSEYSREKIKKLVNREFYDFPFQKEEFLSAVTSLIMLNLNRGYVCSKNQEYIYYSDKSTPMFVNFNLFERPDIKKYLSFEIRKDNTLKICNKNQFRNLSHLRQFARFHEDFFFSHYTPSNAIKINEPEKKIKLSLEEETKALTKEDVRDEVIKLIEEGVKSPEIVKIYPQYKDFEVRGMKVWITRRKKINGESKLEEKVSESVGTSKDLTKGEAIFLLREGYSPDQIYEQYSKTFTKKQLGSFKAWMTMGKKYEDSLDEVVARLEEIKN